MQRPDVSLKQILQPNLGMRDTTGIYYVICCLSKVKSWFSQDSWRSYLLKYPPTNPYTKKQITVALEKESAKSWNDRKLTNNTQLKPEELSKPLRTIRVHT